jgi:hypothetical protein
VRCEAGKIVRLRVHEENKSLFATLTITLIFLFILARSDLEMNITGWCTDICCNSNTEEQCYNPPSCAPVGISHTFLFNMHSSNSFPLTTCTRLSKYPRLLMEAALVQQAKRGAVQVSFFVNAQDQEPVPTLNNCAFLFSSRSDLAFSWCADVCCDENTEETCYNYTGCLSNQYCAAVRLVCIFDK